MDEFKKNYKEILMFGSLIGVALAFCIIIYTMSNTYNYQKGFSDGLHEICKENPIIIIDDNYACYENKLINDEVFENEIRFFSNDG